MNLKTTIPLILEQAKILSDQNKYAAAEKLLSECLQDPQLQQEEELHYSVLIKLARYIESQGRVKDALPIALNALAISKKITSADRRIKEADAYTMLGNIYRFLSDYNHSLESYQMALSIFEAIQDKKGIASSIGNIGIVYSSTSDFTNAKEKFEKALALCKELDLKQGMLKNLGNLGIVSFYLSNYTASIEYMLEALEISEQLGSAESIASCIGNLGNIYLALADYHRALDYSMRALALEEQAGDQLGIAMNTGNIGNIYLHLEDCPKALEFYKKAMELYSSLGNKSGAAINLGNIGKVFLRLEKYMEALEYFKKALASNTELGERLAAAKNAGDIGSVYVRLKEFEKAKTFLDTSLSIAEELGEASCRLNALVYLGEIHLKDHLSLRDLDKSQEILLQVLNESKKQSLKELAFRSCDLLCQVYTSQNKWQEAYEMLIQHREIEKEMNKEAADKMAKDIENKRQIEEAERDRQVKLARFKEQEKILHNILPAQIAERMLDGEKQIADYCEGVSVFFSDIVGFTKLSQNISAQELVSMLNGLFSEFDQIARKYGLEKIKTIGDAYMAAAGIPSAQPDHAERTANFALDVVEFMKSFKTDLDFPLQIRIGLHSGNAVAGIIGENKFAYDIWGDAVNTASRMESHGEAGKIHLSADFKQSLPEKSFIFQEREEIEIKGKGKMKTYFLVQKAS